jgi:hypothetical protein
MNLNVIFVEPLRVALAERPAVHLEVIPSGPASDGVRTPEKATDPFSLVVGIPGKAYPLASGRIDIL